MAGSSDEGPRVALVALGCRVNQSDVDALAAALEGRFAIAAPGERADYVVVSTCTVTNDADSAARQAIRRAAREHPGARIVAAGCYAEVRPEDLAALPGVAAVVGTRAQAALPQVLERLRSAEAPPPDGTLACEPAPEWLAGPGPLVDHTRAFLKVQDGCDARCSYCIIPRARGPSRSLPFDAAVQRIEALGARHAEVVLAGIHLGSYGQELAPRRSLEALVRAAARAGAGRLRISSVDPPEFPLALLERDRPAAVCEHFHLPLQSGSSRVLAAMRRPYRADDYRRILERIAVVVPGACLGADVITGFPGETDADHRLTLRLVEALPLAYLHVFTFSPRPGTEAAALPGRVHGAVAKERARELRAVSDARWAAFLAAQHGRELEVVVERVEDGIARGTSREYVPVRWRAGGARRGEVARVRVEGSDGERCQGMTAAAG